MDRRKVIERQVQEDLARRSMQGVWVQPWVTLIAFASTSFVSRAPVVMWSASALMTLNTIFRLILIRRMDVLYSRNRTRWKLQHNASLLFCAGFWGFVAAFAVFTYGYHDENTLLFILCHAGVALGMIILLVHDNRLMHISQALLYGPLLSALLFSSADRRWGLILTVATYMGFVLIQGKRLHESYWLQIEDNCDLHAIARHDSLTTLPNRLYMQELMEKAMTDARRNHRQMALMYIDLDGFKQVNDRFSHETGDMLLREVARRLQACVEPNGVVARLGGDEFTIMLADYDSPEKVGKMAESVLRSAQDPVLIDGHSLSYSASIGVSIFPDDADTTDHLVRAADVAMYVAKSSGKNQVCFFDAITDDTPECETYADAASATVPALRNLSISQQSSITRIA
jgi:diguanylate cyclase (GGDEF)-like protein